MACSQSGPLNPTASIWNPAQLSRHVPLAASLCRQAKPMHGGSLTVEPDNAQAGARIYPTSGTSPSLRSFHYQSEADSHPRLDSFCGDQQAGTFGMEQPDSNRPSQEIRTPSGVLPGKDGNEVAPGGTGPSQRAGLSRLRLASFSVQHGCACQ